MKILVFMSDNRPLNSDYEKADYNSLSAAINYEYTKKHGYDFIYFRPYLHDPAKIDILNCLNPVTKALRHAAWSKILSALKGIEIHSSYDYIVYIDSDCIFSNQTNKLEEYIKPFENKDIIFLNNRPWSHIDACSGFFICKVNAISKKFLNEWYNINIPDKDTEHIWEQAALYKLLPKDFVGIKDDIWFEDKEGQFLSHVGTNRGGERIPRFKKFIETTQINFLNTIKLIHTIDFSTDPQKKVGGRRRKLASKKYRRRLKKQTRRHRRV